MIRGREEEVLRDGRFILLVGYFGLDQRRWKQYAWEKRKIKQLTWRGRRDNKAQLTRCWLYTTVVEGVHLHDSMRLDFDQGMLECNLSCSLFFNVDVLNWLQHVVKGCSIVYSLLGYLSLTLSPYLRLGIIMQVAMRGSSAVF